ncbi:MAG: 5'/3'-nucleotidase SurE [Myxococcota bacterium]|nr:5'/3'-nucleotidase SurE [Myxococcota bacterium]
MKILISNDDGIEAPGINTLHELLSEHADCRVVAPLGPQSGVGHALTYDRPFDVHELKDGHIAVDGTPADCARLALSPGSPLFEEWAEARRNREIWMVSGINRGANLGMDLYPSGTAAAAREACLLGFRAIAISQYIGPFRELDWSACARRARPVLQDLLTQPPGEQNFWNVNLPHPVDDHADCEVVYCQPDPSPQTARYAKNAEGQFFDEAVYHDRPRRPGLDIDVCFGGRVTISKVGLYPEPR